MDVNDAPEHIHVGRQLSGAVKTCAPLGTNYTYGGPGIDTVLPVRPNPRVKVLSNLDFVVIPAQLLNTVKQLLHMGRRIEFDTPDALEFYAFIFGRRSMLILRTCLRSLKI